MVENRIVGMHLHFVESAFKTKVLTITSIWAVLVFLLYIGIFLILNISPVDSKDIEVVKIEQRESPDSWTVYLKLDTQERKLNVIMNIRDGKIVGSITEN